MSLLDRIPEGSLVGVDTAPWIYHLERNPRGFALVGPFFEALDAGRVRVGSSTLVLGELLVGPLKKSRTDLVERYRTDFVDGPNFSVWDVTRLVIEEAANLRVRYSLKTIDALHLASTIL
jgi:predicted nucleic acid-binding protein